jgi:NtrC-family two-component system sensor histidine kinase KinB
MSADAFASRVLDAMADAVVTGTFDGVVTTWTAAAERMFGWTAAQVIGHPLPGVPDTVAAADYAAALTRVQAGEIVELAGRGARADGTVLDLWVVFIPLARVEGELDGWLAVVRDATRERAVQRDLRRRVELVGRLASVIAGLNSDLDLRTVLQRISASGVQLLAGDGAAYMLPDGTDLEVVAVSGLPAEITGERIDLATSAVATLLESGRASMAFDNADYPNASSPTIHRNNASLPRFAVARTTLDGQLSGALYVFFTDAERGVSPAELGVLELLADAAGAALANARAYDRLERQRAHERAVIDATADGMAVLDANGQITHWNPAAARITGLSPAQAMSSALPFPVAEPGIVLHHELSDGVWLEILTARIGDTGETVVDFRDVTRANLVEQTKDLFLAITSHELRTPITVVQGYASTLLTHWEQLADDERRESVERIYERTKSLAALVEQLLLGSRAGLLVPSRVGVPFDLAGMLHTAVAGFAAVTGRHQLVVDVSPDLPLALGDPSSIEIVIGQLLENAVKYSPEGGQVTVRARRDGAELVVTVSDRGIGIPAGEYSRIFERFHQVGGERRRFGGVGLGLYIVQRLLEAQGGAVRAYPRDGGGTSLDVVLPVAAAAEQRDKLSE